MSTSTSSKKQDRKADGAGRKLSTLPSSDAATRKSSLEPPAPESLAVRRPSVDNRKMSIVDSIPGRSTLIITSAHTQRPNVKYENTYKTEPDKKVRSDHLRDCIKELFEKELDDKTYNKEECSNMSKSLADRLKQRVKMLGFARYKIITVVCIGQREEFNPSVAFTSRCMWSAQFDTFSQHVYKNTSLYALGLVYAMYAE
ncbi:tctex1 domain-containing protein 1-like [Pecten maximus]|uniref:tctex1 domain-containing protein 1-like n=1 Tax=Pecten maximus TaxID=6579 RepID=UPI001458E5D1|nr:tctex1 domain-containing protein 1-like [Pecten maximus]